MTKLDKIPLDEVLRLNNEGLRLQDIALRFGVHPNSLGQHLKHKGICLRRWSKRYIIKPTCFGGAIAEELLEKVQEE